MKLSELKAGFVSTAGVRTGVHFLCPRCREQQIVVPFANPPNGGPDAYGCLWQRTGDTIDSITLSPSVDSKHVNGGYDGLPRVECRWHGWVRNGEAVEV